MRQPLRSTGTVVLSIVFANVVPAVAAEWNAANDFSSTSNPSGPWTYGWSTNPGVDFSPYGHEAPYSACLPTVIDQWYEPLTVDPVPHLSHSTSPTALTCGGFQDVVPDELLLHPGPTGEHSVLRWTAPYTGLVDVDASFVGRALGGTTTDVHVFHNGSSLFSGNVNGTGVPTSFQLQGRYVRAGDTIDFTVGDGSNGYLSDTTGLSASISLVNSWVAATEFSSVNNPSGPWTYGWSTDSGVAFSTYVNEAPYSACLPTVIDQWYEPISVDPTPHLSHSASPTPVSCGGFTDLTPDELLLHPGPGGEHSVLRWTAPFTGVVDIDASFVGRAPGGTTTDVHVFQNGLSLFSGNVSETGVPTNFHVSSHHVAVNDTIDFTVGYGADGNYVSDTTGLSVTIAILNDIPAMSSVGLAFVSVGLVLCGAWVLRRRAQEQQQG